VTGIIALDEKGGGMGHLLEMSFPSVLQPVRRRRSWNLSNLAELSELLLAYLKQYSTKGQLVQRRAKLSVALSRQHAL